MEKIFVSVAMKVTLGSIPFNTPATIEYRHTGPQWFYRKKGEKNITYTESEDIAKERMYDGLVVSKDLGHYSIHRISIPTINAKGEKDVWYIELNSVIKISKYGKKIHNLLSNNINPFKP